jgi:integrase
MNNFYSPNHEKHSLAPSSYDACFASNHCTINPAGKTTISRSQSFNSQSQNEVSREEIRAEFIREIKSKYHAGVPLTLMDALDYYCLYSNRTSNSDERSRINRVAKFLGNPYIHELTRDHFSAYENYFIETLSARTIEERIALIKRIFAMLLTKQTYRGDNPLQHWKPSISSRSRKASANEKIATMERVQSVFGSNHFAEFGNEHRSFYLIIMIAIVTGMRITSICRLNSSDFLETFSGTPIIDLNYADKTAAGKRQIPLPARLHVTVKNFLNTHGSFGIEDRGEEKGCSDAISKLYEEFTTAYPNHNMARLNPHGLRASLNNYLTSINIPFDIRCALVGHKNDHVNSVVYSSPLSPDLVFQYLNGLQDRLLNAMNFDNQTSAL